MEGPSLYLAKQQLRYFRKQKVLAVSGNTKEDKARLSGLVVRDIFSWGKHLVFQFDDFALRVHFMLFGTFAANIDGHSITGDYKKTQTPRLVMQFNNGDISLYNCSIKFIESSNAKKTYDFSISVMSPKWDAAQALAHMNASEDEEVADVLLDQAIFASVGNIIKNEILSLAKVGPFTIASALTNKEKKTLTKLAVDFSQQCYVWRKAFVLRKHLRIYQKGKCPHCGGKVTRGQTGKRKRFSYYCGVCQKFKAGDVPIKNKPAKAGRSKRSQAA